MGLPPADTPPIPILVHTFAAGPKQHTNVIGTVCNDRIQYQQSKYLNKQGLIINWYFINIILLLFLIITDEEYMYVVWKSFKQE